MQEAVSGRGTRFVRRSEKAIESGRLGKAGEATVEKKAGVLKNTKKFTVNGEERIPDLVMAQDRVTKLPTYVGEVKNVKYQSYTQQLKDDVALVGPNGRVDVFTRPTTEIAKPLQKAFDDPNSPLNQVIVNFPKR